MSDLQRFRLDESVLTYAAFRVACLQTVALLKRVAKHGDDVPQDAGYLSEIPLLRETAPQVQLELLSNTWKRGRAPNVFKRTMVDECVIHAAFERAVECILTETHTAKEFLNSGPVPLSGEQFSWLPVKMRTLHLSLPLADAVIEQTQNQNMDLASERLYKGDEAARASRDELFSILGRWRVNQNLAWGFKALLSPPEIVDLSRFLHSNRAF